MPPSPTPPQCGETLTEHVPVRMAQHYGEYSHRIWGSWHWGVHWLHWHPHRGKDSQLLTHSMPQILLEGKHMLSVTLFLVPTASNSLSDWLSLEIFFKKLSLKRGQFQLRNWHRQHWAGCQSTSSAHLYPCEIGFPLLWAGTVPSYCMGTRVGSQVIVSKQWLWARRAQIQATTCLELLHRSNS